MKKIMFLLFALMSIQFVNAATYYVSPNGSTSNSGAENSPWSIQHAANQTNPGDSVYFLTGTYNFTGLTINRSGTSGAYISYLAAPSAKPVLQCQNPCGLWNAINVQASYIKIDGLELVGNNANITLAEGEANYNEALAGGSDWAKYGQTNTNGISIGNSSIVPHHVEVRNCKVHDFAAGGLSAINADYITFENNEVYNNSWFTFYASSGISVLKLSGSGTCIFRGNKVYNNECRVKWLGHAKLSDGNGIIIDINTDYNGTFLVENNLVYDNGGRGLYIMDAGNAVFRNNTSYWNSKSSFSSGGEMVCYASKNVQWINNVAWANPAYSSNNYALNDNGNWGNNSDITWKNNITFNGTVGQSSVNINKTTTTSVDNTNKLGVNPMLVNPTIVTANANFRLQSGSPAINAGTATFGVSAFDIDYATRVVASIIDMGAYESDYTTTGSTTNIIANPNFDTDLTGWGGYVDATASATRTAVVQAGYSSNAVKVNITNGGTANWHVQLSYPVPLEAGKRYSIKFKASADANRVINYGFQQNEAPKTTWLTSANVNITTTPTTYGPYYFDCTTTDATDLFKFYLGNSTVSCYFDEVEVMEVTVTNARKLEMGNKTTIYPNPCTNLLNIKDSEPIGKVSIYNLSGVLCNEVISEGNELSVDMTNLPNGIYIVDVNGVREKVIKN